MLLRFWSVVTRFAATMGPSDSRPVPRSRLCIPARRRSRSRFRTAGSPRFLDESFPARCPQPPRKARRCTAPVTSSPVAGFTIFGRLAVLRVSVTRPNRVHLRYGSQVRFAGLRLSGLLRCPPALLHVERVIHMVDSFHSTRFASLTGTPKAAKTPRRMKSGCSARDAGFGSCEP